MCLYFWNERPWNLQMFSAAPLPSLTRRLMMRSVPTSFKSQNRIPAFKNSFLWALSSWSVNPMIIFNNALIITGTHKLQHPLWRQGEPGVYQFRSWQLFGGRQIQQPKSGGRYKWPCPSEKDSKDFKTAGDWERGRERERERVYYLLGKCCIRAKHMPMTWGIMSVCEGSSRPRC